MDKDEKGQKNGGYSWGTYAVFAIFVGIPALGIIIGVVKDPIGALALIGLLTVVSWLANDGIKKLFDNDHPAELVQAIEAPERQASDGDQGSVHSTPGPVSSARNDSPDVSELDKPPHSIQAQLEVHDNYQPPANLDSTCLRLIASGEWGMTEDAVTFASREYDSDNRRKDIYDFCMGSFSGDTALVREEYIKFQAEQYTARAEMKGLKWQQTSEDVDSDSIESAANRFVTGGNMQESDIQLLVDATSEKPYFLGMTDQKSGDTLLHRCAENNMLGAMVDLLDRGARKDARNAAGLHPIDLTTAAMCRNLLNEFENRNPHVCNADLKISLGTVGSLDQAHLALEVIGFSAEDSKKWSAWLLENRSVPFPEEFDQLIDAALLKPLENLRVEPRQARIKRQRDRTTLNYLDDI